MLHWRKRLRSWAAHVRSLHGRVPWLGMIAAILSGPVPPDVWRNRIRTCARCPVKDSNSWVCRKRLSDGRVVGCNCDLVFLCLTAVPYTKDGGCWAREMTKGQESATREGWGAYLFPSRAARLRAVFTFFSS